MSEFVRRRIKPDAVSAPADLTHKRAGRTGMVSPIGLAAAVAVAGFAALLFVTLFSERDALQSFAAAVPPLRSDVPRPQPAREIDVANGGGGVNQEQSERLLRQFVQWRQKVVVTEKQ